MDQDSAFMSSLMTYLFHRLNIKFKTIAPYNHQSLKAEHGIKSLTHILTKHLTGLGQMWTKYLSLATFAYNTFNFFIAYGLGLRPLLHPYVYAIGLGLRPFYIFPLTKTAYEMGK